jgi:hypothetical protein
MDPVGLPIQSSLAGVKQQERAQTNERAAKDRDKTRFKRALDEAEFGDGLTPADEVEAAPEAKPVDDEEPQDEARRRNQVAEAMDDPPRLDLEG